MGCILEYMSRERSDAEGPEKEAWAPELGHEMTSVLPRTSAGDSRSRSPPGPEFSSQYCGLSQDAVEVIQGLLAHLMGSDEMLRLH